MAIVVIPTKRMCGTIRNRSLNRISSFSFLVLYKVLRIIKLYPAITIFKR